jgi:hypothetical protein
MEDIPRIYMKKVSLESISVLSAGLVLAFLLSTVQAFAQPLLMNTPTNIAINPEEPLPANGTVTISTEGATDTDMNVIPPEGVSVVISNDTITVTNQTVDIETVDEDEDEDTNDNDENDDNDNESSEGNEEGDEENNAASGDEDSGENEDEGEDGGGGGNGEDDNFGGGLIDFGPDFPLG